MVLSTSTFINLSLTLDLKYHFKKKKKKIVKVNLAKQPHAKAASII
jgi:hypothetical protein